MKQLLAFLLLCSGLSAFAQNTIYSHAIGNWRNGPVVYISPLIETTEATTKPQLIARYKQEYPVLRDVTDIDVLLFGTPEEGEESRRVLKMKYGLRKLEVVMLEPPAPEGTAQPK